MRTTIALLITLAVTGVHAAASPAGIPDLPSPYPALDEVATIQSDSKAAIECKNELRIPDSRTGEIAKLRFSHSPKYGDIVRTEVVETFYGVDIRLKIACTAQGSSVASFVRSPPQDERPCIGPLLPIAISGAPPDGLHFGPAESAKPLSYLDPKAHTVYYVESDGLHLAAISAMGRLLWIRNPYEDAQLCPYRTIRPIIVSIRGVDARTEALVDKTWRRHGHYIEIRFDSSQSGFVDVQNGDFFFGGQN